jgi:glycyl-tRNA synthetase (class II)
LECQVTRYEKSLKTIFRMDSVRKKISSEEGKLKMNGFSNTQRDKIIRQAIIRNKKIKNKKQKTKKLGWIRTGGR